jgi:hypothetical protein
VTWQWRPMDATSILLLYFTPENLSRPWRVSVIDTFAGHLVAHIPVGDTMPFLVEVVTARAVATDQHPWGPFGVAMNVHNIYVAHVDSNTVSAIRIEEELQRVLRLRSPEPHATASAPTACVIPGLGVSNINYRDTSGDLHELWRDAQGNTGTTNLTAYASAPTAVGNPFAYVDTSRNTEILLYRGRDGLVQSLYWSTGPVGHDNLSGSAGAPKAAGDPVGYYAAAADTHHVIYRTGDGHLHELNWTGVGPVVYGGNLTGAIPAPTAAGQPSAFVNAAGVNFVVYRADVNDHILSLYWADGPSGLDDLSGFAGTPPAAGDPVAYHTAHDDIYQVVYLGNDGHLWELYWQGPAPVVGWDITAQSGAPPPAGTPAAYYNAETNTKHVIYRSANGRLHEIWWVPAGTPVHVDVTDLFGFYIPPKLAAAGPAAFTSAAFGINVFGFDGPNTQHVVYTGTDIFGAHPIWEGRVSRSKLFPYRD